MGLIHFYLTESEAKEADKIIKTYHSLNKIWPKVSYIFHPTGIGDKVEISVDNNIYDITDYESW